MSDIERALLRTAVPRERAAVSAEAVERPGCRAHANVARLIYVLLKPWTVLGHWTHNEVEAGQLDGIRLIEAIARGKPEILPGLGRRPPGR